MPSFIKLKKEDREKLFYIAKEKTCKNYEELALKLNISKNALFKYKNATLLIPKRVFIQLQKIGETKIRIFREVMREKYETKSPVIPLFGEDLAEILGVLNGDGHISQLNNEICVVGNSKTEMGYFEYLKIKFERIFSIPFKIRVYGSSVRLRSYSYVLADWLNSLGLPKGNKIGKLHIPQCVLPERVFLKAYIRGLFDTDSTIYTRRKNEPVIEISSADDAFLEEIKNALNSLDFSACLGNNKVVMYNRAHINKFFEDVKPANPQHLKRYNRYLEQARVV